MSAIVFIIVGMDTDWNAELVNQLDWHWQHHLRPRLDGITDEEYFWEPVAGSWNLRPRGQSTAQISAGTGDFTIDFAIPEPDPAPVTTIAWRLAHIIVDLFLARTASHFGGPPADHQSFEHAATAAEALRQLDDSYAAWVKGVRGLTADDLGRPVGPGEGPFADSPMAELVLHINREVIHHGAEVALLRDLYPRLGR